MKGEAGDEVLEKKPLKALAKKDQPLIKLPQSKCQVIEVTLSPGKLNKREIQFSKSLSAALRHNALDWGLQIDSAGFVKVQDLLAHKKFKGLTPELLDRVLVTNEK